MTLNEVKKLLSENNISFELCEFETEAVYWHHTMLFPYTNNAKDCKVIALIILSKNEKKNIELQFNAVDNIFQFEELRFGDYCFEMYGYKEEMLADELLDRIKEVRNGNYAVIIANNLKNRSWIGDACFDLSDDDEVLGRYGFENAMERIKKPNKLISRLFGCKTQYEIYDWNTYRCIIK